ncbi:YoaK family protein [Pseudarthrobacter sp. MEB009]|uniref:YoaK family protein n=1 Tax=Pseudarthrobacter sp. MEB009 TaxID=3040326 RepID=UPI002557405D|nr:YoaK family protein [Pseudarthrobacter sp. MEB009]
MPARLSPANPARLHLVLMLVLTFSTGVIDAVGYLGLDRVFTGNMTGNVVILGMALMGGDDLPILGPIVALVGFMLGALLAGRTLRPSTTGWNHRTTGLLLAVGVVMLAVAVVFLVGGTPRHGEPLIVATTGILAVAMGVQAATARHLNVKDVPTVVVTSTITGLAADSRFGAGTHPFWGRRLMAVVLILAGAAAGAGLLQLHIGLGVLATSVLTVGVAVVGGILGRGPRPAPKAEVPAGEAAGAVR